MTAPERWSRIEALYHAARDRGAGERAAFLDAACGEDLDLRREVESLLAQQVSDERLLGTPAIAAAAQLTTDPGASMLTGRRIGIYEIQTMLGAGGMGEVYRAHDTRLRRDVAIKVLPRAFTADSDRLARFEREARALAALNHPNIATIHGLEESDGVQALVLELVEGETLAEKLSAGALPIAEALGVARQIVDALDVAHERGIIHRDLKPANIKIRPDGTAKVLDFGLAKLHAQEQTAIGSDALTIGGTREGVVLGTAAYMSPEQARGQTVDKRTDIWAFGCVLYEMLTGHAAFRRETLTDTLSAVVDREPQWAALPDTTPVSIRRLIARCLAKDVRQRLRDIGDARNELDDESRRHESPPVRSRSTPQSLPWIAGAVALVAVAASLYMLTWRPLAAPATTSAMLTLAPLTAGAGLALDPAISRDGALVAYASDRAGHDDLDIWVQQAASGAPIQVTHDLVDESEPAFSPDGARIVFRSEREGGGLYVVPALGGQEPRLLVANGRRPRFSPDGKFIAYWTGSNIGFSSSANAYRAFIVPANGGAPRELMGFTGVRYPVWSPDGQALLVLASRDPRPVAVTYDWWLAPVNGGRPIQTGAFAEMERRGVDVRGTSGNLGPGDWRSTSVLFSDFHYLWSLAVDSRTGRTSGLNRLTFGTGNDVSPSETAEGVLTFSSFSSANNAWAVPIDANRGVLTGPPRSVTNEGSRPTATIDGRLLAYHSSTPRSAVLVKDLETGSVQDLGVAGSGFGPAISPDGSRVAFESEVSGDNVSVVAIRGGAPKVVCEQCSIGEWSADGRSLTVIKPEGPGGNAGRIELIDVDRGVSRDLVVSTKGPVSRPFLNPAGTLVAFRFRVGEGGERVMIAPVRAEGAASESDWVEVVPRESDVRPCSWSPDGGLLYFVSSRDGTRCLYACRIDRETGRPQGSAFVVSHFHGSRNIFSGAFGVLSTGPDYAVRGGFFFYDRATLSSNIWKMAPATK